MIANARMYAVNAHVAALWERLFAGIATRAGVALDVLAHAPPLPLEALWRRDDLGCAFMCGYPWSTWRDGGVLRPQLLAAPRPAAARYGDRAVYCTDIVVRADDAVRDPGALRGTRFAYTTETSQSGYQAPREFFADVAGAGTDPWFAEVVGPLQTPRAIVDAVIEGGADAGPLDSYWHDLLRRHEPGTAARLRTIASTPPTPIPPLVCAASTDDATRLRLIDALRAVEDDAGSGELLDALMIRGFSVAAQREYAMLAARARDTDARGYPRLR